MFHMGRGITGVKKDISTWAKGLATEHCKMLQYGNGGGAPWCYFWAKRLVQNVIREAIGLDQCKAPLRQSRLRPRTTLHRSNNPVYEVFFGQSECAGLHTVSFLQPPHEGH